MLNRGASLLALTLALLAGVASAESSKPIQILFLGDNGHHQPALRFKTLQPVLYQRGIELTYSDDMGALNKDALAKYDGLMIYANTEKIKPEQEAAMLEFVASGKGFIPLHCASFCFQNSPAYIDLVGAQFKSHKTGTFKVENVKPDHPIMQGFNGFESWDETYVHAKHNEKDRTVLEVRAEGDTKEPWTWVRTFGKGRVFYTAWGHDDRTWGNPGFQSLVDRGVRWAVGQDAAQWPKFRDPNQWELTEMTPKRTDAKPFEFTDVGHEIPIYKPGKRADKDSAQNMMQNPLEPEESIKHFVTPKDFEMKLFASEKDFQGKPIAMTWDERGRLWMCETVDYPNELHPNLDEGRDHIRILEDTDGDGVADKFTLFADKLSIPTSIAFYKGGVIVQNAKETLYLKDTDGDDKADERKVLYKGWNTSDTHGMVSNFQYGLDNWIWAMQGYNDSHATDASGKNFQGFRQGFFRFKQDGSDLEFLRSTDNNTWGFGMSEEGIIFGSTANHNPSDYMPIPNRYYDKVRGWSSEVLHTIADTYLFKPITENVRQVDQFGGYTAGAGHALYTARTYPQDFWNRTAFVAEPTGHLVGMFLLKREGADYKSTSPINLVASDDEWSSPIMAEVGPDGNMWVIDWYNYIIQHNPTPAGFKTGKHAAYESNLRDHSHGRIYRVVYKPAAAKPAMTLAGATPQKLVETLKNDNLLWRRHAQRLLVERGQQDVVPDLAKLVADKSVDGIGLNVGAIHALWTLEGLGALKDAGAKVAVDALAHPSAGVRRNALQVLPKNDVSTKAIIASGLLDDQDMQVRLAAILAIADSPPSVEAAAALAKVATSEFNLMDRWLADATISAGAQQVDYFIPALAKEAGSKKPKAPTVKLLERVGEHFGRREESVKAIEPVLAAIVDSSKEFTAPVIVGMAKGWPEKRPADVTPAMEANLEKLFGSVADNARGPLLKLAVRMGSKKLQENAAKLSEALLATVTNEKAAAAARVSAAAQYIEANPKSADAVKTLVEQITPAASLELAQGLIDALSVSESDDAGKELVAKYPELTPAQQSSAVRMLLKKQAWVLAMLSACEKGAMRITDLSLDQRQQLATFPGKNPEVRDRAKALFEKGGGLPDADREKVFAELKELAQKTGDHVAGKEMFTKHCAKCHTHSGVGGKIGPDLTGMAVHPKEELLLNILIPSKSVESNFRAYVLQTKEGETQTGLLASESSGSVTLLTAEGKMLPFQRIDLEVFKGSDKSLMPDGFEKQMTKEELTNLLEFLSHRDKYTPLPFGKHAVASSFKGIFVDENAEPEKLLFPTWGPQTFEGIPFVVTDPQEGRMNNVVILRSDESEMAKKYPQQVKIPMNGSIKAVHLLSGISGWGFPFTPAPTVSMVLQFKYADGSTEDHELKNGEYFSDYISRNDVPKSKFAFALRNAQIRYFSVEPKRKDPIAEISFIKGGNDRTTAPVVMGMTIENLQ
jgi:putative membrane-bound dehydrogenase-like protein